MLMKVEAQEIRKQTYLFRIKARTANRLTGEEGAELQEKVVKM